MKFYLDLFRSLSEELDPRRLQHKFLSALLEMQGVCRGSIWIKQGDGYKCVEALGEQSDAIQGLHIGAGEASIVGWVIENRQMTVAEPGDGRHRGVVEDGLNGLLAGNEGDWVSCLDQLIQQPELRQRLGRAGRATVLAAADYEATLAAVSASGPR